MIHAALYRYDASLAAVPDLAAEPCDVADDLVTITCSLRAATFHDGSPVTAEDVVYEYQLANSQACVFVTCLAGRLRGAVAVDAQTVRFTLERPYAPFVSSILADILIEPRRQIETAYKAVAERAKGADPAPLEAVAGRIREGLGAAEPDCESSLEAGEKALTEIGVELADRRLFVIFLGRGFDACAYAEHLAGSLDQAARSLGASGLDAVAAAYPLLPFQTFNELPIGAGPWRVRDFNPETGLTLESHAAHHHGAPATPEIRVRVMQAQEEIHGALADGSLDWLPFERPGEHVSLREIPSIKFAEYPTFAYGAVQYNLRPGRLFADRNLRQAVELCIDKERIVQASVGGGVAIYSPIPPASWAYQPGLARPRDVAGARQLIEASGWEAGDDGVYARGTSRLAAEIVLRADIPPAMALVDRIALQLRDCGIELTPRGVDFRDALGMLETFPHVVPGSSEPFDVYFGGWAMGYDPDVTEIFHSSRITSETQGGPPYFNYVGFSDTRVDALLDEGLQTYDQARRTEIYRELQRVLAEEQPYLFVSAIPGREPIDADLATTGEELDLESPNWWWQLETLVNPDE
ncbi:MAG: hypothetical protein H0X16_09860 [Chloroflexi bacterium]|nr:hypothetical protein [Chloroflexota bacterium]